MPRSLLAACLIIFAIANVAHAKTGTVAVFAPAHANACGGALTEAIQELRSARFLVEVVLEKQALQTASSAAFDALLRFNEAGDSVAVVDLSVQDNPAELATLRLDCAKRLSRRRVWTIVVEMLWSRPDRTVAPAAVVKEPAPANVVATTTASPASATPPPASKQVDFSKASVFFGAAPVYGTNALVVEPAWDVALLGGYRSAGGWRVGGRLRWPVSVSQHSTAQQDVMRLWTFTADVETTRVFAPKHSSVHPFVGGTWGLSFALVDVASASASQERRWAALHARALGHLGIVVSAGRFAPFCQLEAGAARRLRSEDNLEDIEGRANSFVAAASLGVLFDY
ncbi:MAG: hypothetical protein SF187_03510 [Deltaproteobacteria bacterium]|nr:hypothetical protein [Deltaproteobacteria bacterium]